MGDAVGDTVQRLELDSGRCVCDMSDRVAAFPPTEGSNAILVNQPPTPPRQSVHSVGARPR